MGSSCAVIPSGVFIQDLFTSSIMEEKEVQEIPPTEQLVLTVPSPVTDWREQFIKFLTSVDVPVDKTKIECLIHRSKHYVLVDRNLMRKSAKEGYCRNASPKKRKLLLKINSGSCDNHVASRNLFGKAF